jgi:PAS domain S-box-containing protein
VKKTEKELQKTQHEYEEIFQAIGHPTFILTPKQGVIAANKAAIRKTGLSIEELKGKQCYEIMHGLDHAPKCCPLARMRVSGKLETAEIEVETIGGTFLVSCTPVLDDDNNLEKVIHIATDITDSKQAETKLRALSYRQEAILAAVPDIIMEVDNTKVYTWANQAGINFFGPDVIGKEAAFYFEGEQKTYNVVQPLFNGREDLFYVESWQRRKDGQKRLLAWWCRVLKDDNGKVVGALSSAQDISERKQAEEALRASEEKYSSVVETSNDGIIIHRGGLIKFANKATFQLIGYTSDEIVNRNILEFIHPNYQQVVRKNYANRKVGKDVPNIYEIELIKKDGTSLPVELNATIMNYEGEIAAVVFLRDIAARKQAEIEIKKRQRYLESVIYNTPSAIVTLDANHKIVDWNPAAENIFKYKRADVVGKNLDELLTTPKIEAEAKTFTEQILAGEKALQKEIVRYTKDKKPVDLILSGSGIKVEDKIQGAVAVYTDITERKLADEQIRNDLKEKETLLREIHHRVKNNLQVISSMLNLQSRKMEDLKSALSLQVGIRRIHSMALIHEKLYESKNLVNINFSDYIINISKDLIGFYDVNIENIKVKYNLQDILLGIDTAIPCGLIVNELITNCLKYAFPENRKGTIKITFKKLEEYLYKLIVEDDGVGINKNFNFDKIDTLGLQLVKILARQIEGTMTLERDKGTTVIVKFKGYEYVKAKYSKP